MLNYLKAEHIKHKSTFAKKLIVIAPVVTLLLNALSTVGISKIHIIGGT